MKIYKFWAEWCGPCKQLTKILESTNEDLGIEIVPINVDEDTNDLCSKYNIRNIPTMIMVDENENELKRVSGVLSIERIKEEFNL